MKSCPLGHTCDSCLWHVQLRGTNPQSGQEIDQRGCAIAWLPVLLIENAQQGRGTAAAVESFRNEVVKGNQALAYSLLQASERPSVRALEMVGGPDAQA